MLWQHMDQLDPSWFSLDMLMSESKEVSVNTFTLLAKTKLSRDAFILIQTEEKIYLDLSIHVSDKTWV